jgi:penicillin amidase
LPEEVTKVLYGINSVEASNNWAIHGNFTANGKPLLGGDPHLGCKLPAFWQMMELSFDQHGETHSVIGGSIPGVPAIIVGHSLNMAWSTTSPHTDNTDLWQERLSEDGSKYLVDGQWRDLTVVETEIKVKGKPVVKH